MRKSIISIFFALLTVYQPLCAEIKGKVDIGPVLVDIDILESGKTVDTQHMKGVRGDATVIVWRGIFLKPSYTWATGDGRLSAGGIGIGQCIPINDKFMIMGSVGVSASSLRSKIDIEPMALSDVTQKFRSTTPYIALEFTYQFAQKWTLMGLVQYGWARTHTKITKSGIDTIVSDKGHSCGPNYSLGIDYSINKHWSVTFAGGYNLSLSHEKHGIRAKGVKLGLAYYF